MPARRRAAAKAASKQVTAKRPTSRQVTSKAGVAKKGARWSQHVTETSDAMDLKPDVFKGHDPAAIARSVKSSAEHSDRRKTDPYRSSMSMLTFYVNRAGHNLEAAQRHVLDRAKDELRKLFGKEPGARKAAGPVAKKPAKTGTKSAAKKVAKKVAKR